MKISRKKILIAAIVFFCLFLLIVFGLGLKQMKQSIVALMEVVMFLAALIVLAPVIKNIRLNNLNV